MAALPKRKKKMSVSKLLGLNDSNPADQNFLAFQDILIGIHSVMIQKGISKNELARRLKVSRQAIYDKFTGRNLTMKWILKACNALGVTIRVSIVDKKKAA
jgi:DNA-binding Xre family transcriptional regulator